MSGNRSGPTPSAQQGILDKSEAYTYTPNKSKIQTEFYVD